MSVVALVACATLDNLSGAPPTSLDDGGSADALAPSNDGGGGDGAVEASCSTDLETDAKHCGRCGHDCQGGACTKGACQAVQLIAERANLFGIIVDATHVYYLENVAGIVARIPKAGGVAQTVCSNVQSFPRPFAVDDQNAYCSTSTGIVRVTKTGLTPTLIVGGARDIDALFVDGSSIYGVGTASFKAPITGGAPTALPIAMQRTGPLTAEHDATTLFANHAFDGIYVSPKSNASAPPTRLLEVPEPSGIALDAQYAYVAVRTTGTVKRIAKTGGTATNIVTGVNAPRSIAVDDANVFFATGDGSILSCPRDGCTAPPRILAEKQGEPLGIAVDAVAVYWTSRTNGTVMRVAK